MEEKTIKLIYNHNTGWVSCDFCYTSWKNDRPFVYRYCPYCGRMIDKDCYEKNQVLGMLKC